MRELVFHVFFASIPQALLEKQTGAYVIIHTNSYHHFLRSYHTHCLYSSFIIITHIQTHTQRRHKQKKQVKGPRAQQYFPFLFVMFSFTLAKQTKEATYIHMTPVVSHTYSFVPCRSYKPPKNTERPRSSPARCGAARTAPWAPRPPLSGAGRTGPRGPASARCCPCCRCRTGHTC